MKMLRERAGRRSLIMQVGNHTSSARELLSSIASAETDRYRSKFKWKSREIKQCTSKQLSMSFWAEIKQSSPFPLHAATGQFVRHPESFC